MEKEKHENEKQDNQLNDLFDDKSSKKGFIKKEIRTVVVDEHGEVLDDKVETELTPRYDSRYKKGNSDFCLIYDNILDIISELNGAELKVLLYLCFCIKKNSGEVIIIEYTIKDMSYILKLGKSTIRNSIKGLKDKRLMYSKHKQVYLINPLYLWRGDNIHRDKARKELSEIRLGKEIREQ